MIYIFLCSLACLPILATERCQVANNGRVLLQQHKHLTKSHYQLENDNRVIATFASLLSRTVHWLLASFDGSNNGSRIAAFLLVIGIGLVVIGAIIAGCAFSTSLKVSHQTPTNSTTPASLAERDLSLSDNKTSRSIPWWQWFFITAFQLVYSTFIVLMATFVLPQEAERMHKDNKSAWISVYIVASGLTQICCPIVGKLSDRHSSRYGKRRPFIVGGALMLVVSLLALWRASEMSNPYTYLVSLFFSNLFLNTIYSVQAGLPADLQGDGSEDTSGITSGFIAFHSFLGALSAMALLSTQMAVQGLYPISLLAAVIVSLLVCIVTPEAPSNHGDTLPFPSRAEILQCFVIDLKNDLDFFWVCLGRLFFYINIGFVCFTYYYLRDMIHIRNDGDRRQKLVTTILIAQILGAIFSPFASWLSGRIGRKRVIYTACVLMSITHVLYIFAPKIGPGGSWSAVEAACVFYGAGCGLYLSVDYAIALDCLPSGKSSAEALGLWGVVGFLGSTLGPVVSALLLMISSRPGPEGEEFGYVSYAAGGWLLGVLMAFLLILVTIRIKKVV